MHNIIKVVFLNGILFFLFVCGINILFKLLLFYNNWLKNMKPNYIMRF